MLRRLTVFKGYSNYVGRLNATLARFNPPILSLGEIPLLPDLYMKNWTEVDIFHF